MNRDKADKLVFFMVVWFSVSLILLGILGWIARAIIFMLAK